MHIKARLEVEREIGGHTFTGLDGEPDTTGGHLITVDILVAGVVTDNDDDEATVDLDPELDLDGDEEEEAAREAIWCAYLRQQPIKAGHPENDPDGYDVRGDR